MDSPLENRSSLIQGASYHRITALASAADYKTRRFLRITLTGKRAQPAAGRMVWFGKPPTAPILRQAVGTHLHLLHFGKLSAGTGRRKCRLSDAVNRAWF
ncbi:MAG: hypothetical protein AB1453_14940 [Chloroflexota bacterium]|jgi:hypothetical protein